MWIMVKPTTHEGAIYQAFETATPATKHRSFSVVEEPRLIMETYDWCVEHFDREDVVPFQSESELRDRNLSWYFWGRRVMIRDPVHALEFRMRWC